MQILVQTDSLTSVAASLTSVARKLAAQGGTSGSVTAGLEGAVGNPALSSSVAALGATLRLVFLYGATSGEMIGQLVTRAGVEYAQTDSSVMPAAPMAAGPAVTPARLRSGG